MCFDAINLNSQRMKLYFTSSLLLVSLLISCNKISEQGNNTKEESLVEQIKSDITYSKEFYDNSKLKVEGWEINGAKNNFWIYYYENGSIKKQGHFDNDLKTDYWEFFNNAGNILSEGQYTNDIKTRWWKEYDEHGILKNEGEYLNGRKNGYWKEYKNGVLYSDGNYDENRRTGTWNHYNKKGEAIELKIY